jgi:pimeloyl-ACP methyl ester carboxylesterase
MTQRRAERIRWRSPALGPVTELNLERGRLRAHVTGDGPAIVFVHGALVNANLWRKVVPSLDGFTRVALDMPLGSHVEAMPDRDLSVPGAASLIGEAVEALGLRGVTLVGNDTGGALCQVAAAARPGWLGRLVLTSCDAFENFPPGPLRHLIPLFRLPGAIPVAFAGMRSRRLRQLPIAYGLGVNRPIDREAEDTYALPMLLRREIRADLRRFLHDHGPPHTIAAAERLREFDRPALIAWSANDRFFPRSDAERLASTIPGARLEWVEDSRTFSPEDQPERLAELVGDFVRDTATGAAA